MSDVFLVRLVPSAESEKHHKYLINDRASNFVHKFNLVVEKESQLNFMVTKKNYSIDKENAFKEKLSEINKVLEIEDSRCDGSIIGIDKYPISQYLEGFTEVDPKYNSYSRYEVQCLSPDNIGCETIILLCPDFQPIVLADLNFAYNGIAHINKDSETLLFTNYSILSVKSLFGEFIGINLKKYNKLALDPEYPNRFYAIQFEKITCSDAVLQHYLDFAEVLEHPEPASQS